MANLVLGVVGAAVGTMFGMPQLGWAIGSMVGGMLFKESGPDINQEGPRLGDLKVQTSKFGAPIPKIYGSFRVAGNVIWSQDVKETKHTNSQSSGGKGGGGQTVTQTTYTYSITSAVMICEGPIQAIRKIWANNEIIYNAGDSADIATIVASNTAMTDFKVYYGTEDQMPDPTMQSVLGADNVPAYRGIAYVVLNDLQLEKFGNRPPNLEFEVIRNVTSATGGHPVKVSTGTGLYYLPTEAAYYARPRGAVVSQQNGIFKLTSWAAQQNIPTTNLLYIQDADGNNLGTEPAGPLDNLSSSLGNYNVGGNDWLLPLSYYWLADQHVGLYAKLSAYGTKLMWGTYGQPSNGEVFFEYPSGFTNYYDPYTTSSDSVINIQSVYPCADQKHLIITYKYPGTFEKRIYLYELDVMSRKFMIKKYFSIMPGHAEYDYIIDGRYGMLESNLTHLWINTGYQCVVLELKNSSITFGNSSSKGYHNTTTPGYSYDNFVCMYADGGLCWLFYGAENGGATDILTRTPLISDGTTKLSAIVSDLCSLSGLSPDQYDTTQLTDDVTGYLVSNRMSIRAAIEPLQTAFLFDAVERDGKIVFVKRGGNSVVTIDENDLGAYN